MIRLPESEREGILGDLLPDLTPLLDVMFMLIVFLILTANAVPFAVDVQLPSDEQSVSKMVDEEKTIILTLLPEEKGWKLNQDSYTDEAQMQAVLLEQYNKDKEQRIIIAGEKSVSMQKLLNAITFLRKHNIQTADILMEHD